MIDYLNGQIASKRQDKLVLDVGGIGYAVNMSSTSISELGHVGEDALVHIYMSVSDSGIALYGFVSQSDKDFFEKLITVSGIGPKIALAAISTLGAKSLSDAIIAQDAAKIATVPGIGKKSASRIILELKDALGASSDSLSSNAGATDPVAMEIAVAALLSMGFTSSECELALKGAPEHADDKKLIQYALKRLGTN